MMPHHLLLPLPQILHLARIAANPPAGAATSVYSSTGAASTDVGTRPPHARALPPHAPLRRGRRCRRRGGGGIFNYLPLLEMALLEMGLLGLVLRFCHRLLSGATHLGLLVTWQATSPIQRGIGRGNDPRALPLSFTIPRRLPTVARFCFSPFPASLFLLAADAAAAAACCHCKEAMA
jgi:hypothetical protein